MTDDLTGRYVRRALTSAEARELAQKSLDDPGLFEDLTASAVAATAFDARSAKVVRFPRRIHFVVASAAAAAVVLVALYSMRPSRTSPPRETALGSQLAPALASSAKPGQPILLASGFDRERNSAPVFRSPEPDSRAPRPSGSIGSIEDGEAMINLGSLDGLGKGSEVQLFRNEKSIGHAKVTAVFRERARILGGPGVRANDRVRVADDAHFDALLQQADALSGRGDSSGARTMMEKAAEFADTAHVPARALERLAALEYQAALLQAAEKHYQSAEPQESLGGLNTLAVLHMLRGDYDGAETALNRVVSTSPKTDPAYALSLNNLGVLAELRGDKRKAEAYYADALLSAGADRKSVEANLARVRGAR